MDSGWQYFAVEELSCHGDNCCGGQQSMLSRFMVKVVRMRRSLGFALPVSSAYRCPLHNSRVSHTGETGPHTMGCAMDFPVSYEKAIAILEYVYKTDDFTGGGVRQSGPVVNRIIHLDDVPGPKRIWTY